MVMVFRQSRQILVIPDAVRTGYQVLVRAFAYSKPRRREESVASQLHQGVVYRLGVSLDGVSADSQVQIHPRERRPLERHRGHYELHRGSKCNRAP